MWETLGMIAQVWTVLVAVIIFLIGVCVGALITDRWS